MANDIITSIKFQRWNQALMRCIDQEIDKNDGLEILIFRRYLTSDFDSNGNTWLIVGIGGSITFPDPDPRRFKAVLDNLNASLKPFGGSVEVLRENIFVTDEDESKPHHFYQDVTFVYNEHQLSAHQIANLMRVRDES